MAAKRLESITELAQCICDLSDADGLFVLAIAGPPGSGKSTLAEGLRECLPRPSCVIPMDGFHLDNAVLQSRGLLHRKGAPETFDLPAFLLCARALCSGGARRYPTFDRAADSVVPQGGTVPDGTNILIFEGNYLLLDEPGWRELRGLWHASAWLDVPAPTLKSRLVQRWITHGMPEIEARVRAEQNDLINVTRATERRLEPTWILSDIPA